jgi:hypothetical protein
VVVVLAVAMAVAGLFAYRYHFNASYSTREAEDLAVPRELLDLLNTPKGSNQQYQQEVA